MQVMDTVQQTVTNSPSVAAAQTDGLPVSVDVSVELKNAKTGQLSHSSRSMDSTDDWTAVLADSLQVHQQQQPQQQQQAGAQEQQAVGADTGAGIALLAEMDPRALLGGAQPVPLRTVQARQAQQAGASVMHKVCGCGGGVRVQLYGWIHMWCPSPWVC